ncbi:MAG: CarD family transcriptional regulator, partial [Bacillota bacterium]
MSFKLPASYRLQSIGGEYSALYNDINSGKNTAVFYATQQARYYLTTECNKFFLYITADRASAHDAQKRLQEFLDGEVVLIREKEDTLLNAQVVSASALQDRLNALTKIYERSAVGAVISIEGIGQLFPSVHAFGDSLIRIKVGQSVSRDEIIDRLLLGGYRKEEMVENAGDFAVRGDIVDIFAMNTDLPVRIEFFDDVVEDMRYYSPESMLSVRKIESVVVSPRSDILINEEQKEHIKIKLMREKIKARGKLSGLFSNVMERFEVNPSDPSLVWLLPFILNTQTSIFSYLPADSVVVLNEPRLLDEKLRLLHNAHILRVKSFIDAGELNTHHSKSLYSQEEIYTFLREHTLLSFQNITSQNPIFQPEAMHSLHCLGASNYHQKFEKLAEDIAHYTAKDVDFTIFAGEMHGAETIKNNLSSLDIHAEISTTENSRCAVTIVPKTLAEGFIIENENRILLGTNNVAGTKHTAPIKTKSAKTRVFTVPEVGSLVVHNVHGIGLFEGIKAVDSKLGKQDFYTILYRDGARLYLPVNQIDSVENYVGGGKPRLDAIGGKDFAKVKERVKTSTKAFAIDLLALYESRRKIVGHTYEADTVWQQEMEDDFAYQETPDQLIAVDEIKRDMESGKLMDRLICGDVGFGKTEVAIRAMFKTIMGGKQTAILCPTTILCQQHYNTISMRLKKYGFKIDILSRMESQNKITSALKRI